jgi:HPt (histidine-containing phosphotransfer) domain-containing protein
MSRQLDEHVMDRATALARVGGDLELLKEIAVLFLDEYPRALDDIHRAVATGNAKLLENTAHGLKGSVANFCASSAEDAAFQLEQMGRAQKLDQAPRIVSALEQALALLQAELASL